MHEYAFDYQAPVVPGRVVFRVVNTGKETHNLIMVPIPDDFPPIDEQLHGDVRRPIYPVAQIFAHKPGTSGTFAVDLVPHQRYAFMCAIAGTDGQPHFLKGMNSEFRAGDAPAPVAGTVPPPP
jgi:hypothetical protein